MKLKHAPVSLHQNKYSNTSKRVSSCQNCCVLGPTVNDSVSFRMSRIVCGFVLQQFQPELVLLSLSNYMMFKHTSSNCLSNKLYSLGQVPSGTLQSVLRALPMLKLLKALRCFIVMECCVHKYLMNFLVLPVLYATTLKLQIVTN